MLKTIALLAVTTLAVACSPAKKTAGGQRAGAPPPTIDTKADQAEIARSWLSKLHADSEPLVKLAQSNPGWNGVFRNDPMVALEEFEKALAGGSVDAQVGAARSALELAATHRALGRIVVALTPALIAAQATRPKAEASAAGRAFILARHALATGRPTPAAAAQPPYAGTDAFEHRLRIRAAVAEGQLKEARARLKRIDPTLPDLVIGAGDDRVVFRDPATADVGADVYAAIALEAVKDTKGWPQILAAEAELALGRPADADKRLAALLATPPQTSPALSQLVLSAALNGADLTIYATALQARAKAGAGDAAGAKALAAKIGTGTVAHRVFRAWALAATGDAVDEAAFPTDRGELSRVVVTALAAQAEKAGATDVQELLLVDRYVDALQRLFATALEEADKPVLAVRMRDGAEDKAKAAAPSIRNALSSLVGSADAYVRIRQPRIALKYLTRLAKRLPAVAGAVEMLRDVLSLRAMGQGGGAATGQ